MMHQYYEPTEYESMLIAAGWIDPGSVDPDYQKFLKAIKANPYLDELDYQTWQEKRREWDRLDSECERIEADAPHMVYGPLYNKKLDRMSELEIMLGL